MMKSKLKGFSLVEVIISIALLSILSLGLVKSLLSISGILTEQNLRKEMINIGEEVIEKSLSGINYKNNSNFKINVQTEEIWEKINKIYVKVCSEETDYEVEFTVYTKKEN